MNQLPVAIGLVLCEVVIVDGKTRNVTPVNCFSSWRLRDFPGAFDFHVVAWLADGMGEMSTEIVVQRLDSLDEVFRLEGTLHFKDPLKAQRVLADIRRCPVPVIGYYGISLIIDGEVIAQRKIRLYS